MKQKEIQYNMSTFINSKEFKKRKIELKDREYIDKNTGIVYAIIVDTLKEISELPKRDNPVIYLSDKKFVLNRIGEIYHTSKWDSDRMENLTGDEFDYIYLRQCNMLKMDKELKEFKSEYLYEL